MLKEFAVLVDDGEKYGESSDTVTYFTNTADEARALAVEQGYLVITVTEVKEQ